MTLTVSVVTSFFYIQMLETVFIYTMILNIKDVVMEMRVVFKFAVLGV